MNQFLGQESRFAVYLIPPFQVARAVMDVRLMLRKQFGFAAANKFQVHSTIKGFFKRNDGPLDPLLGRLNTVIGGQSTFPVHFSGYHIDNVGIGLDISQIGE